VSPETRAFLDRVRDAEDPPPEVEERVLLSLNAAVAAGTLGAGALGTSKLVKLLTSTGIAGWKLGALGLCLFAATSAVVWPREGAIPPRRIPVPVVPVRAPVPARASVEAEKTPAKAVTPLRAAPEPPKIRPSLVRAPGATSARSPSLRDELSLLSQVQAALQRGDGDEALRLLDGHHTSDRQLGAERAAARVLSLCAAGKTDEARNAAATFAQKHPNSLQTSAVARSCAGKEQP
jgi:hypothetical protein